MAPPLLEPQAPSLARQHYRGRIDARRKAVKALRFFVYVAVAAVSIAGWYVGERGFGRQSRVRIIEELHKRGVEASMHRLTLDPFRGLIAQDVRIFDSTDRNKVVASISEVALDINYAALFHHQAFLNALDVRNADVTIPLAAVPGLLDHASITDFRAHIFFPPEQIYVSQAEGVFAGVRISATGQVIKPADYKPAAPSSDEEWRRRLELLQRVVSEIARCGFPAGAPSVQVKFTADLSKPDAARATATIQADRLQRGAYELKNISVAAEWANQALSMTRCEWVDNAGNFSARANWSRATGDADMQARSTLNARQFLDAFGFGKFVSDLTFSTPPLIDFSGSANFAGATPYLSIIGRTSVSNFSYKSVPVVSLSTDFAWDGARTMLRGLRVHHESGDLNADVFDAPDDFRLKLESAISPNVIGAIAPPALKKFLADWEWPRPPKIQLNVHGRDRTPETWTGDGSVALGRTRFRGVWMNSATSGLRFGNQSVAFEDFRVTRDEGSGAGAAVYDFAKHEVRLSNVKTTLRPSEVIYWVEPRFFKNVVPYKFRQPPNITVNGVVQFHGGKKDHLELLVDASTGMEYVFLGKTLPIDRAAGRLLFTEDRLQITDLVGDLFEGKVRGGADISLAKGDDHYRANVAIEGMNFPVVTDLYFKYQSARGRLGGSYEWTGIGDNARTMVGAGKVRVTEGNVFAIPIFGPLSGVLSAIFPGAGYSVAHEANASFTIREGVIHTDDFKVSGKLFGMVGHGDIRFLDDKLDFDLKISGGGAGALLTPVYNLFEYKGEGSITKPNWHPKRF
ncbi:MAG: AsmA-like C-terminal region-containing protein [Verrucomicrobiota bacterium]|nr:AsmA-like C-terminal region-containing protein [Verrucomicrobiota bacterium]